LPKRGGARHRFNLARSHLTIVAIAGNRSNRGPGSLKFDRSASAYCYHSPVVHELLITIRLPSAALSTARQAYNGPCARKHAAREQDAAPLNPPGSAGQA
jgi:hypothetical protein